MSAQMERIFLNEDRNFIAENELMTTEDNTLKRRHARSKLMDFKNKRFLAETTLSSTTKTIQIKLSEESSYQERGKQVQQKSECISKSTIKRRSNDKRSRSKSSKQASGRINPEELNHAILFKNKTSSFFEEQNITCRMAHELYRKGLTLEQWIQTSPMDTQFRHKLIEHYQPPDRIALLLDKPRADLNTQIECSWNPEDHSPNVIVHENDKLTPSWLFTAHYTDYIRGKIGFTKGLHVWEITWLMHDRGKHPTVGVATSNPPVPTEGCSIRIVGSDDQSWGWDLNQNKVYHSNHLGVKHPSILKPYEYLIIPDKFLMVLDMDKGTLGFIVDNQYLGDAFQGLNGQKLYPIVSTARSNCDITLKYIGGLDFVSLTLQDMCRLVIRKTFVRKHLRECIEHSELPRIIKSFMLQGDNKTSFVSNYHRSRIKQGQPYLAQEAVDDKHDP